MVYSKSPTCFAPVEPLSRRFKQLQSEVCTDTTLHVSTNHVYIDAYKKYKSYNMKKLIRPIVY